MTIPGIKADHPLRRLRQRRGLTQVALADLSGLSNSFVSMVETGERKLSRRDHVNALARVLQVAPSEIAPGTVPGLDEWASAGLPAVSVFPSICDDVTTARHVSIAKELAEYVKRGDYRAAGMRLRRAARDPGISPWMLLDLLITRDPERWRTPGRQMRATGDGGR